MFGLVPAVHGTGGPVDESLRSLGRSSTGSRGVQRLRRALVGSQFAIATPLLVVAGLLLVSLNALKQVDLGFDSRNLLTGSMRLPAATYSEPARIKTFYDELKRRVEALPGAGTVAFSDSRPPNGVNNFNNFDLEEFPTPPGQSQPATPWVAVTPDYFRVLGLRLIEGRLLEQADAERPNLESVVVDRAWARRFFPNQSAIGKRFREGGCTTCPWTSVVGVVSEVKYVGLDQAGSRDRLLAAGPAAGAELHRCGRNRTRRACCPSIRQVLRELDPDVPLSSVATMDELVAQSLERPQSLSMLVASFALVALVLSIVGIYGVMTYYVQQHSKDISIRLALGGTPGEVPALDSGSGHASRVNRRGRRRADSAGRDATDVEPAVRRRCSRCGDIRCRQRPAAHGGAARLFRPGPTRGQGSAGARYSETSRFYRFYWFYWFYWLDAADSGTCKTVERVNL